MAPSTVQQAQQGRQAGRQASRQLVRVSCQEPSAQHGRFTTNTLCCSVWFILSIQPQSTCSNRLLRQLTYLSVASPAAPSQCLRPQTRPPPSPATLTGTRFEPHVDDGRVRLDETVLWACPFPSTPRGARKDPPLPPSGCCTRHHQRQGQK
jgi:hypothetical protein